MIGVLYDGWDLAFRPNSPAALHLLTLLAARPAGVRAVVGLPAESFHPLPKDCQAGVSPIPDTPSGRLGWEQRRLPGMAKELGADLIHSFSAAALFGGLPAILSPADPERREGDVGGGARRRGAAGRLREALGAGGRARLGALFWPEDLERVPLERGEAARRVILPAVVHPEFLEASASPNGRAISELDLPETFVLYQGSDRAGSLQRLLSAWSWAVGPIGEYYPLVAVGVGEAGCAWFGQMAVELELKERVRCLPALPIPALAAVYRASSALFHPEASTAWGGPLRQGLACGKPLVGLEEAFSDAILGAAGYLVRPGGTEAERNRALGAALITVIVEEGVAEALSNAAVKRAENYRMDRFSRALGEAYQSLIR